MPLSFCNTSINSCCEDTNLRVNLTQGETINYRWIFQNSDGTPIDLTGYYFQIGILFNGGVFFNSNGNGLTIDGVAGTVTWSVADTVTANYPTGTFAFEFFGTDSGDNRAMNFAGTFNINQSFTSISS